MTEQYSPQALIEDLSKQRPTVVALEGGPCGGKSTIAERLIEEATRIGRTAVIVPEAATELGAELLKNGSSIPYLAEHDRPAYLAFQKKLLRQIVTNVVETREQHAGTNALIIADRCDLAAYVSPDEYDEVLQDTGFTAPPHMQLIDKVLYLPSLARENPARYTELMSTNATRFEDPEAATETCQRNLETIGMHPGLRIYWGDNFEDKVQNVLASVLHDEALETPAANNDTAKRIASLAVERSQHEHNNSTFHLEHYITEAGYHARYITSIDGRRTAVNEQQHSQLRQLHKIGSTAVVQHKFTVNNSATLTVEV